MEEIAMATDWQEIGRQKLVSLKNSDSYRRLLSTINENKDNITKVLIDDYNVLVESRGKFLFERKNISGGLSIVEQQFIYESIKKYFGLDFITSTNLYDKDVVMQPSGRTIIEKKQAWSNF